MDFRSLSEPPQGRGRPKGAVQGIRAYHHRVAMMVASGMKDTEIAKIIQRTPPTVRNWRLVPANAELAEQYKSEMDNEVRDRISYVTSLIDEIKIKALEQELEQLVEAEETGERIPIRTLDAIAADKLDRRGYPKTQVSVGVSLGAGDRLAKARERVAELNKLKEVTGVVQGNVVKLRRF
jgi:hypothetical protein